MNKGIAHILKEKLAGIPFITKLAGLVYTAEYRETDYGATGETPTVIVKRIPLSCDLSVDTCEKKDLVPDSTKKGVLYFEDNGITALGKERQFQKYRSRLRLVAWINTNWIKNDSCIDVAGITMNYCIDKLSAIKNKNLDKYIRVFVQIDAIPRQDKNIFAAYTYDSDQGYLLPPYEFFAIDFTIEYMVHESCLDQLEMKTEEEFSNQLNCSS